MTAYARFIFKKKKHWKMDIFDSKFASSEKIWTIDFWRTPVSNQAGCHYHYATKRTKTPAPEGPLGLTRARATQSAPLYCISSVTSADFPCFYPSAVQPFGSKTDKTEQNRFNEDKCANLVCTNVAFQVSSDAFFFFSLNHCNKADPSQICDSSGGGRQRPRCPPISSL